MWSYVGSYRIISVELDELYRLGKYGFFYVDIHNNICRNAPLLDKIYLHYVRDIYGSREDSCSVAVYENPYTFVYDIYVDDEEYIGDIKRYLDIVKGFPIDSLLIYRVEPPEKAIIRSLRVKSNDADIRIHAYGDMYTAGHRLRKTLNNLYMVLETEIELVFRDRTPFYIYSTTVYPNLEKPYVQVSGDYIYKVSDYLLNNLRDSIYAESINTLRYVFPDTAPDKLGFNIDVDVDVVLSDEYIRSNPLDVYIHASTKRWLDMSVNKALYIDVAVKNVSLDYSVNDKLCIAWIHSYTGSITHIYIPTEIISDVKFLIDSLVIDVDVDYIDKLFMVKGYGDKLMAYGVDTLLEFFRSLNLIDYIHTDERLSIRLYIPDENKSSNKLESINNLAVMEKTLLHMKKT